MVTDPIADLLIRIKNANAAGKKNVTVPYSKAAEAIVNILKSENFIAELEITGEKPAEKAINLTLIYRHKKPVIAKVIKISKPGRRIYAKASEVPVVKYGRGLTLVSTSKGILSNRKAQKLGLGGEVIAQLW
jgi:small subunit ribosomal protein S8